MEKIIIGDLPLKKVKELKNICNKVGWIRSECYIDCKYFDEKECDCKLSFVNSIDFENIDLDKEIEEEIKNG